MDFTKEFETVELLINSNSQTKMVDAFSLALIKCERQIRRIFTFLIFQNNNLTSEDVSALRETLSNSTRVYFEGFINGIDNISIRTLEIIYGERYSADLENINKAITYRNKIFHGQLTTEKLTAERLAEITESIKSWCRRLSEVALIEYGYCGFGRNSFRKSNIPLDDKIRTPINSQEEYRAFITQHLERQHNTSRRR